MEKNREVGWVTVMLARRGTRALADADRGGRLQGAGRNRIRRWLVVRPNVKPRVHDIEMKAV